MFCFVVSLWCWLWSPEPCIQSEGLGRGSVRKYRRFYHFKWEGYIVFIFARNSLRKYTLHFVEKVLSCVPGLRCFYFLFCFVLFYSRHKEEWARTFTNYWFMQGFQLFKSLCCCSSQITDWYTRSLFMFSLYWVWQMARKQIPLC